MNAKLAMKAILVLQLSGLLTGYQTAYAQPRPMIRVPASQVPDKTKRQIEALIDTLSSAAPGDKQAITDAAKELANHPYQEVATALLRLLERNIMSSSANSYHVMAALEALQQIATTQEKAEVKRLSKLYDSANNPRLVNSAKYINAGFEQILANIKSKNIAELKSLNETPKPVTSQGNGGFFSGLFGGSKTEDKTPAKPTATAATTTTSANSQNAGAVSNSANGAATAVGNGLVTKERAEELEKSKLHDLLKANKGGPESIIMTTVDQWLSDDLKSSIVKGDHILVAGREKEAEEIIDVLVRIKGKNPVLVGPPGAGKTTVAIKVAEMITLNKLPLHPAFKAELGDAHIISTTPAKISRLAESDQANAQAAALEKFFDAVLKVEQEHKIKIVVFIDEMHNLGKAQLEAMKPYMDSKDRAIRIIGASTAKELNMALKSNPAMERRIEAISIAEQSIDEVIEIFKKSFAPQIKAKYDVTFSEDAIRAIVENATKTNPDTSRTDGSFKLGQAMATVIVRQKSQGGTHNIDEEFAFDHIAKRLGYPVNPLDPAALATYRQDLIEHLDSVVIGQHRMNSDLANEWMKILQNNDKRGVRVVLAVGPTGTGKSLVGRTLAKKVFGREGAFLEVDANNYKDGKLANNTFFGAPNGVVSSDTTSGVLFDYLDDPTRGKFGGIILINEGERAHADFWEKMMEMMDTGKGAGADGKVRNMSRHIIIITTNRGDHIVFPQASEKWTEKEIQTQADSYNSDKLKALFTQNVKGEDDRQLPAPVVARIDKATLAMPMTKARVTQAAFAKADAFAKELSAKYRVELKIEKAVIEEIVTSSFKYGMGVRPVEKAVEEHILNSFNQAFAEKLVARGDTIELRAEGTKTQPKITAYTQKGKAEYSLPKVASQDPLDDEMMERLVNLPKVLGSRVIGQDEVIARITQAARQHYAKKRKTGGRPLSFFSAGTTGTGKTELAKALAQAMYDSADRAVVLPMGDITYEGQMNDTFNPPSGHVGSTQIRRFEQALIDNPNGAVINFSEVSNMGGKDKAVKAACFKYFYNLMDEGKWNSSVTNKDYDLTKYIFLFDGNDGEELFRGASADDIRTAIWKDNHGASKVRALLTRNGVPEAFIGRLADAVLNKPLLKTEVAQVTEKLLKDLLKDFTEDGVKLQYDAKFLNDLSQIFFTQEQGARSIRNMIEYRLSSLITFAAIELGGRNKLNGKTLVLSVQDNAVTRPYAKELDPVREVKLAVKIMDQGSEIGNYTLDATEYADKQLRPGIKMALSVSYHEAGHAVVNDPNVTSESVAYITIQGANDYLGYARYEQQHSGMVKSHLTERLVTIKVAQLLAGQIAQRMAGYEADAGWESDLSKARKLISNFLLEQGMGKDLQTVAVDSNGKTRLTPDQARQMSKEFNRIYKASEDFAKQKLSENWYLVRDVVGLLMKKGTITGKEFQSLSNRYRGHQERVYKMSEEGRMRAERVSAVRCVDLVK